MKALAKLVLIAPCMMALGANAQTSKPGLWEVTSKVSGSPETDKAMADMQKQMAGMPPEQRKQMEAMMGKQGMSFSGPAGAMVMKSCVTKEMVEQSQLPVQTRGTCTSTTSEKTSTSMKFSYACTNPPSIGQGQFNFLNDRSFTSKMKLTTTVQGKQESTTVEGAGKWLGTDCGQVKPISIPSAAGAQKP